MLDDSVTVLRHLVRWLSRGRRYIAIGLQMVILSLLMFWGLKVVIPVASEPLTRLFVVIAESISWPVLSVGASIAFALLFGRVMLRYLRTDIDSPLAAERAR